ncbi:MAG: hypothetical protein HY235_20245 [Acidobacteria bacterium]|nr:hypothetical protein [Acidobacteriota bacterium]
MARIALLALLGLSAGGVCGLAEAAGSLAKQARKAEQSGDSLKAYLLYSQAAAADPKHSEHWVRAQALRTRALRQSKSLPASLTVAQDSVSDAGPSGFSLSITREEMDEARRPLPPVLVRPQPGNRDFDLRGDARSLFQQVLKAFGVDLVFDADYQPGPSFRFRLDDVDFRTALRALESATSSFVAPLGEKLLMVYKDTQQKRAEAEPTVAVTIGLPGPVTIQEAQELARSVQQLMEIQRFAIDSGQRLVLIKDRVSKVRAAQNVFLQLLTERSQVMVEVELLDFHNSRDLKYGGILPTATALTFLGRGSVVPRPGGFFRIIPEFVPGFTKYVVFGGGLSTIALAIMDSQLFASISSSQSQALFRAQVRSLDAQTATFHVGDKYPIVTQQYLNTPGSVSPLATPTSFQFEDLGLSLKITPRIHDDREISLQVEAEFKLLGNGSYNGVPVIANRKFASSVRLRNGEYAVLAGLLSSAEARGISGLPWLGQTPLLSSLTANNTRSKESGETLVVIKPHILDSPATEMATPVIYTGTEARWVTIP